MNSPTVTKRQKQLLAIIYEYIKSSGYPPTFEDMKEGLNVSSNQSIVDLLARLAKQRLIRREESLARSITILPLGYKALDEPPLAPFLGISHTGMPIQTLPTSGEWVSLSDDVAKLDADIFLLKVSGDSMINAGIDDQDIVLVKSAKEFVSGEIVLADVDGETTIKRFISEDKPPYLYLRPENPNYKIIYFTERVTLKGKIISILKKGQWIPSS